VSEFISLVPFEFNFAIRCEWVAPTATEFVPFGKFVPVCDPCPH